MPSPRASYTASSGPIIAENATLPALRAAGFEVRVNAYVVGRTHRVAPPQMSQSNLQSHQTEPAAAAERDRSPGCQGGVTDLWYLSLVGARGQGTSLRAVWANLVSNHSRAVWLEGVGSVTLGHSRLDLAGLGYPIHWTYRQAVIPPSRDVQGVLESDALTCHDPLLVPHQSRSHSRRPAAGTAKGPGQGEVQSTRGSAVGMVGNKADGGALTLTSAASSADGTDEAAAREARPIFLLLVPTMRSPSRTEPSVSGSTERTDEQARDEWLARLHLRYLAARIPWLPYYPAWSTYLWQRARERGEAEALHVWCYGGSEPQQARAAVGETGEDRPSAQIADDRGSGSYLTAAFLCRPDPLALTADLSRSIARGSFQTPVPPTSPARSVEPLAA